MEEYINNLKNRYATKKFDVSRKLTADQMQLLINTLILAPSSFGLQPYKFILVEDAQLLEKLREACYNQPQVTESSMFVVLCYRTDINEKM
ncbi:nitroreductase family protein, partial [candidate division WWE3 bacterium]|nr:nitroreductase family protein [candidate division WWE3 bacterium]